MNTTWQTKKLEEICDIARGGSPRPIKAYLTDDPDGINWIKIGDATASNKYIYETKQKIRPEGIQRSRLVQSGDFLLSNSMSFGRPYIMRTSGCIHDGWLVLSDKTGLFDQNYLYYFLGSPAAYQQFDSRAAGSTVRNLNIDLVKSVEILLPPLPEQKRIVAILDEAFAGIDAAIANTEKNLANAREIFESYLNNVFTKKGEGWVEKKLVQCVSSISTGPFGSMLHKSDYTDGGIPIVNPINIIDDRIEANDNKTVSEETVKKLNTYILDVDDIVIGRRGEIGRCAVVQADQAGWLCGTGCFYIKPSKDLNPNFLVKLLRSSKYREELEKVATGATMKNLSNNSLKNLVLAYPKNPEEQYKFLALFDELSATSKSIEAIYQQKLSALNELKQSLLAKAFSGELTAQPEQILKEAVG